MTYVIAEPCVDVMDSRACPSARSTASTSTRASTACSSIDPNECIDCGACEPECPVNAIFPEESLPPEWARVHADQRRLVHRQGRGPRRHRRPQARLSRVAGRPHAGTAAPRTTGPPCASSPSLPSATEIVFALGLGDELVGRHRGLRLPPDVRRRAGREPPDAGPDRRRRSGQIHAAIEACDAQPRAAVRARRRRARGRGARPDPRPRSCAGVCAVGYREVNEVARRLDGDVTVVSPRADVGRGRSSTRSRRWAR